MKQSECSYSFQSNEQERVIKNIFIFFDVADRMILCGRNVAFSVWKGRILIESETMAKK